MVDITEKSDTLRTAIARATVVVGKQETLDAVEQNRVPKGNVFESARIATLFAVKKTSDIIPDCHPLPIEYTSVSYQTEGLNIYISVTVKTIYKTGVEVEAMHGASVAALTMYDMLKPIDKNVVIKDIYLVEKSGGKSQFKKDGSNMDVPILVVSKPVFTGKKEDNLKPLIADVFKTYNLNLYNYTVCESSADFILQYLNKAKSEGKKLVLLCGGTGLTSDDITTETVKSVLTREIPGIAEAMRSYGMKRTPHAMISRSIAGYYENMLIIAMPGSTSGLKQSLHALFPFILHLFDKEKK